MLNENQMKAIVYEKYGSPDVLQLKEVEKPTPKQNEVLVEVYAASINYIDWQLLRGKSFLLRLLNGLTKPRKNILGDDIAGQVKEVGEDVNQFEAGDEVFGISDFGAFADYCCVNIDYLANKPANLTFQEAAAVPTSGITALLGLHNVCQVQAGQKVLINGASGGVGTFAVQIAKSFGAEVTGVCSTSKMDMVRSIGADQVIDYTQEDFTRSGQLYDLIFDVAAYQSIFESKRALKQGGNYMFVGGSAARFFQTALLGSLISRAGNKKLGSMGMAKPSPKDFIFLKELLETGKVIPVIEKCYMLSEVPEALRYYGSGQTQGKVVIIVK